MQFVYLKYFCESFLRKSKTLFEYSIVCHILKCTFNTLNLFRYVRGKDVHVSSSDYEGQRRISDPL